MTLSDDLRATPCPFKPTLERWARAIDNGHARRIAEEMRAHVSVEWPGVDEWRGLILGWADRAEGIAVLQELEESA